MIPNLIVICGTTASGKTRLGVRVARYVKGEIISVDSRQVYRGMDVGTGKDRAEYDTPGDPVPVHLLDIADPRTVYTLWNFQRDFYRVFGEIRGRAAMPVAVGGSGLYLESVLRHYLIADVPEDPLLRETLMNQDKTVLDRRLFDTDPQLHAKTDRSSKKRIVRALEIAAHLRPSGSSDSPDITPPEITPLVIGVRWPRPVLHERIRSRLLARMDGLITETQTLLTQGVPPQRLAMLGLEYKHAGRHLLEGVSKEQMFEDLFIAIRQFAKRQETYFRGMEKRGVEINWVGGDDFELVKDIIRI